MRRPGTVSVPFSHAWAYVAIASREAWLAWFGVRECPGPVVWMRRGEPGVINLAIRGSLRTALITQSAHRQTIRDFFGAKAYGF